MASRSTEAHVIAQLRSVLEDFGGWATHQQLTKRYQELCGVPFDTVWMRAFQIRTIRELMERPSFRAEFSCTTTDDNGMLSFHLRRRHPDKANLGVKQLREALEACGGVASFSTLQNAFKQLFDVMPDENWRRAHFGSKNMKQVVELPVFKNAFKSKLEGGVWTFQERADPHVEQWVSHLTEVLKSLGGSATHMQVNHEFKQHFGFTFDESWKYHFNTKTLKEVMQLSVVRAVISTSISASGLFAFSLQPHPAPQLKQPAKNPATKPKVPDINQIRARAVSQFEDVLQSMGGSATFPQLEFCYQDRFGRSFEDFLVNYFSFNRANPNGLNGIPAFRAKIRLVQDGHTLTFQLKSARSVTAGNSRRRPPKHVDNEGSPELGVKQLITALRPFIHGATFNELNKEYKRLFGSSMSKCWADCFEEIRLPQMLEVPEFKELVNIWQEDGTWTMQLKPRGDLDELTKNFYEGADDVKVKNESPAHPEAPATKMPDSSVTLFDSPKHAVTKLRKILKHLGGRATLEEVNTKCQERYGAPFDVRWSKENGVPDMETLVTHPLFTLLLASRRINNSWEFKMREQSKIEELTTQGVRQLKSALESFDGRASEEEIMQKMGIATWAIYFPAECVRKLVEIPKVAEIVTAAKDGGKWMLQLKKEKTVSKGSEEENTAVSKSFEVKEKAVSKDTAGNKRGIDDELASELENQSKSEQQKNFQLGLGISQILSTLVDLGGMATFASLTNNLKKRYKQSFILEPYFNQENIEEFLGYEPFYSKMEILQQEDHPFRLLMERHWEQVEARILAVIDDSDEECITMSVFNDLYFAQFGLYTEIEKYMDGIVPRLPGKEVIIKDVEVGVGDQHVTRRGLARRNPWKAKKRTNLYPRGDLRRYSVFG